MSLCILFLLPLLFPLPLQTISLNLCKLFPVSLQTASLSLQPGRVAQSVGHLTRKSGVLGSILGPGNILSFLLPLFQEGQLSVSGESMCTG